MCLSIRTKFQQARKVTFKFKWEWHGLQLIQSPVFVFLGGRELESGLCCWEDGPNMSDRRMGIKMLVGIWKEKGKSLRKLLFKMKEGMEAGCAAFVSLRHRRLEEESLLRRAAWKAASGSSSLLPRTWVQMLLDNSNQRVFSLAFKMAGMINYMNNFGSLSRRGWYLPAHICSYAYLIPDKRSRQEVEPHTSLGLQKWRSILGVWTGEEVRGQMPQLIMDLEALNFHLGGCLGLGHWDSHSLLPGFFRWTCHH